MSQNGNFSLQGLDDPRPLHTADAGAQKFLQRRYAIAVHAPQRMGQLIGVAAPFNYQLSRNQRHRMIERDAQPKIIILADREALIETARLIEKLLGHHHR